MGKRKAKKVPKGRLCALGAIMMLCVMGVSARLVYLHLYTNDFLQSQGEARSIRTVPVKAFRGMILDRNGEPLAVSSQVDSLWVVPQKVDLSDPKWHKVMKLLDLSLPDFEEKLARESSRSFLYIKRHVPPTLSKKILSYHLAGLQTQTEYRRYYPMGEVTAHVVGMTDLDQVGQEGLEMAYNDWLTGTPGKQVVLKDRLGRKVEGIEDFVAPKLGQDVMLSLDSRLQYLVYREVMQAVKQHGADSGTAVMLDVETREVLAMVNYPSYNPNQRVKQITENLRNKAVTDQFEPGSVLKVFSMANVLASGQYEPNTPVDTNPGWMKVGSNIVRDIRNFGLIDVSKVMTSSSNVGLSKLTLSLPPESLPTFLRNMGFGESTYSGFPGERSGVIRSFSTKDSFSLATLSFGYAVSVTPLQLANSYAVIASRGFKHPVSFLKQHNANHVHKEQVMEPNTAWAVSKMLQSTTMPGEIGARARVAGYQVAGKTGTTRKVLPSGYSKDHHLALFAGFAPAEVPKFVLVVMIDNPTQGKYYGGQVAAPVFSAIMREALRLYNIPSDLPDKPELVLTKK